MGVGSDSEVEVGVGEGAVAELDDDEGGGVSGCVVGVEAEAVVFTAFGEVVGDCALAIWAVPVGGEEVAGAVGGGEAEAVA